MRRFENGYNTQRQCLASHSMLHNTYFNVEFEKSPKKAHM